MGKLARIAWPQQYSELQRIEELLLCGICYDYMDTSVMTPCSHNYCSLCIRKYLHYKTQCPACFEKTFEKDLHTNRILDELVSYFSKIREKLVDCIAGARIIATRDNEDDVESTSSTPVRPARMNQSMKKLSPQIETEINKSLNDNNHKVEKVAAPLSEQPKILSSPSTSGLTKIATIFTPRSKKNLVNCSESEKTVPCPVCTVEVSKTHINRHLDDCLKRETVTEPPPRIEQKRKPFPKLVFSLMKDAELRKKLKELGLPSQGDRKTLEARFHRYSTLYNAECDKKEPRPIEELLRQCEHEENLEKKMLKFAQAANRLKVTRNSEQSIIEEAQKKYLETNRQNYRSLIASIKDRDKNRKSSVRRSLIEQDVEASADAAKNQSTINNINDHVAESEDDFSGYSMAAYEATFQDSDSSSSCPLQHYTSDDPMNYLSFTMSTSEKSMTPPKTPAKSVTSVDKRINGNPSLDAPISPVKNTTLRVLKNEIMTDDDFYVYHATTDPETSDEEVVSPSPKAATSHTTKRAKLTLREKIQNMDKTSEHDCSNSEGQQLARSIARDFTFDTSSNDSVESKAVNGTPENGETERQKVESDGTEHADDDFPNRDKENHETIISCPSVVNRPLRKRNCVVRSQNVDAAKSNETITVPQELPRNADKGDEKPALTSRADSPLKRRRRRKVAPNETETINPPRRPLRKRLVNSASTEKPQK